MAKSVTHADKADLSSLLELSSKFYIARLIFSHYCYCKNVSAYGDDKRDGFLARKRGGGMKAIASGGNAGGPLARKGEKRDGGSADAKKIMGKDFFPTRGAMFFSSSRPPFSQPPSRIKGRRTKDPLKTLPYQDTVPFPSLPPLMVIAFRHARSQQTAPFSPIPSTYPALLLSGLYAFLTFHPIAPPLRLCTGKMDIRSLTAATLRGRGLLRPFFSIFPEIH